MSPDCPGWSGYPRCTGILRHSGWGWLDVPGLSGMVWVSSVYGDTQTQWLGKVGCPGIVRVGLGILGVQGYSDTLHGWGQLDVPGLSGMVWVSSAYGDTQTHCMVGESWMFRDCPGWSGYTEVQDIVGRVFIRILGQVSPVLPRMGMVVVAVVYVT